MSNTSLSIVVLADTERFARLRAEHGNSHANWTHVGEDRTGLRALLAEFCTGEHDLLIVQAGHYLPPRCLERMQVQPLQMCVSTCDLPALQPLALDFELPPELAHADDIDAALAAFASPPARTELPLDVLLQAPLLWLPKSLQRNFLRYENHAVLVHTQLYAQHASDADCLRAQAAQRAIVQAQADDASVELLSNAWHFDQRLLRYLQAKPILPLRDDPRPRLLHILHDWGGGTEMFARDYALADRRYRHLWLQPKSLPHAHICASELRVFDTASFAQQSLDKHHKRNSDYALANLELSVPIASTVLEHEEYDAFFQEVLTRFDIAAVFVSSVLGHSFAALKTALPGAIMLHDFFPLWPRLHVNFGDSTLLFDAEQLAKDSAHTAPIARKSTEEWHQLAAAYCAALSATNLSVIAPSEFVARTLKRVAPALSALPIARIGHGLQDLGVTPLDYAPNNSTRMRLLVPGRLQGGKGEDLLLQAWPLLENDCELYLLGAGAAFAKWLGKSHVYVLGDYQPHELAEKIRHIAPDLALLPRTVAETFSYSLSELLALGIPCAVTDTGALSERVRHAETGFVFAPTAQALHTLIAHLRAAPDAVQRVRANLRLERQATVVEQAERYATLIAQTDRKLGRGVLPTPLASVLPAKLLHARYQAAKFAERANALQQESIKRGEWGNRLAHQLDEKNRWIAALQSEGKALLEQIEKSQVVHQDAIDLLHQRLKAANDVVDERWQEIQRLQVVYRERDEHMLEVQKRIQSQLDESEAARQEMLNSSSWKLTQPMRSLVNQLKKLKARLSFQMRRALNLFRRTQQSLRTRGVRATLAVIVSKLTQKQRYSAAAVELELPEVPAEFAAFALDNYHDAASTTPIKVSVVIPVYNKFHYTVACLRSLLQNDPGVATEVIVVDDCSSDETPARLAQIAGIVAYRNPINTGFIGACNAGLRLARGEFVIFLNNDTAVQSRWITALLDVYSKRADAGLVGSKLVYPDGRLQESGGIIFNDGSGWNYGRFGDPSAPSYNFVREVDYVSGAAIMVRRELLNRFGGFDTLYTPAYYEDTDLAFKVRDAGMKCYVAPRSVVVHFEGISSGTDVTQGIKRFQVINQEKFLARWRHVLVNHPPCPPQQVIEASAQHRAKKRVLVVDAVTPMPDQDSGSVRMMNLLKILLAEGCAVWFFCEGRHYHTGYTEALQDLGVHALYAPYLASEASFFAEHGKLFDAILLSRHYVASPLMPLIREHCKRARIIFDTVDLHFLREERQAELTDDRSLLELSRKTKQSELALMQSSDVTLVVSPIEQGLLKSLVPNVKVDIISNIHELAPVGPGFAARADALFVGGFQHPPNVDAMLWFGRNVLPLIVKELPNFVCHVVGSKTPDEIKSLAGPNLKVHGFVEDLSELLAQCRISIAPLRYGAGVKGKVNMAMAHGMPVVATTAAVEGMHCESGVDVLVADDAEGFARACIQLDGDADLWQRLSEGGRANLQQHFSFDAATTAVRRVFAL